MRGSGCSRVDGDDVAGIVRAQARPACSGHLEVGRPDDGPHGQSLEHEDLTVLHHTGVDGLGVTR